ncbi:putative surface protein with fasciclin (FAS1) repeats [Pedobacter sp. CG_S7]|uniref:fasciclin domain-containing protein n=1 Tax=Pedobacter sp. CG_S7 TaxID=3143930 RepID=UPI00339483BB
MKNLNLFKTALLVIAITTVGTLVSWKKHKNPPIQSKNIVEIISSTPNFSLLKTAVVHANLTKVLSGKGKFTVFAPDNDAFIQAGFDTDAKIKAVPAETMVKILMYHVVGQEIKSTAIATAANTPVKSAADLNVFVTKNASGVYVNGAKVTQADMMASNGIIHTINNVLMPPAGNIVEAAQGNTNFTYLVEAILRASEGTTNVAQVLSGAGPFTVFAPTNQAFITAGFPTIAAINAADPATLTNILTYHVVAGRIFSSDLVEGSKPATVNSATLTITLTDGAKVKGNTNTTPSNITSANMVTTNGVIHVIDQVLLP